MDGPDRRTINGRIEIPPEWKIHALPFRPERSILAGMQCARKFLSGIMRGTVIALLCLAVGGLAGAEPISVPARPNILLILADDMGWSDLGCYGGEIHTPNLDKLAEGGLRFTQIHNTAKCFPSRACLLTGLYAQQCGMAKRPGKFRNAVTLGEVLRTAGYRTLMTGKHHGTDNPYERGFDHYYGLRDGAANYFNPGHPRAGEPAPAQKRPGRRVWCFDGEVRQPFTPEDRDFYSTDAFTDWALDFLERTRGEDRPFFLYVAYQAPHDPLQARPEDIARYRGKYRLGYEAVAKARYERQRKIGLVDARYPRSPATHRSWEDLSETEKDDQDLRMAVYAAMIECMDRNIGRLLDKIRQLGETDNTLVLFASDNGCSAEVVRIGDGPIGSMTRWASLGADWANVSNTPFRYFKNYSHEGGTCTPMIAFWPAGIHQAGAITHNPGHFIDIMPTLVELAGGEYPVKRGEESIHPMAGQSLVPAFRGETPVRKAPLFWEWSRGRAIRTGPWKLVSWNGDWELYDMRADRTETHNLAADYPETVKRLAGQFQAWSRTWSNPESP